MKKKLETLMILTGVFLNQFSSAQNLVPNWSFEDTVACPNNYAQLNNAVGWSASRISPDYFNSCNHTYVGVPVNDEGYQFARNGNAYAGFITYATFGIDSREIIGCELIQPLTIGIKYYITFYVSRALGDIQHTNIATNKIGARFSTNQFTGINPIPIDNAAHIYTDSVVEDTLQWVKISGSFTADSSYQFLNIGNFFVDSLTTHIAYDSAAAFGYYYIDDVFVSVDSTLADVSESIPFYDMTKLYPNPVSSLLNIDGRGITQIEIYNVLGELTLEQKFIMSVDHCIITIGDLPKGFYFIKIFSSTTHVIKIILI